jgi:hypothetical protein
MRFAILSSPACPVVTCAWFNGADPNALPLLLADRIANGESFPSETVVRLPRRFSRMRAFEVAQELGRGGT